MSVAEKVIIQHQLIEPFRLLRAIPRPCDGVALGTGNPPRCFDMRRYPRESTEQITTEIDFNRFLTTMDSSRFTPYLDMARSYLREDHEIVMTHGDLHPRNIMVSRGDADKSIKMEAIIDWEVSRWYPAYWEYVKALHTISAHDKTLDWYRFLPTDAIGIWGAEYAIDKMIDRMI
jgi:aminoglycoside phosphotransferase (APT) family kinase protein